MPLTPLVLLHFLGSSRREWSSLRWAPGREVLALDLPGFGDRAGEPAAGVAAMADDVGAAIVASGIEPCVVVGHSMSAKVATVIASRRPAWLRGLVLVAGSPPSPEPMDADARDRLLAYDGSRAHAEAYVDGLSPVRLGDAGRELAIDDAMRASVAAWHAWAAKGSREDWSERVGVLDLPTLIVAGAIDPSLGEAVQRERMLPHFGRATMSFVDGGHALPLENPVELQRVVERFVNRVP